MAARRKDAYCILDLLRQRKCFLPQQWVKLAGLDLRLRQSGTSVHAVPVISRQGKSFLRSWLYLAANVAVRYDGPFREL